MSSPSFGFVIIGGTCGSGKSTVANELAQRIGYHFCDGDDFHSTESKAKMAKGIALSDDDRLPWLERLSHLPSTHPKLVLACSALKQNYRQILINSNTSPSENSKIFMLTLPREILEERLAARPGHFVKGDLLDSQLSIMELPKNEADEPYLKVIDGSGSVEKIVELILEELGVSYTLYR